MQCFFMQVSLQVAGSCRFLEVSCKLLEFKKINLQKALHGDNLHFDITIPYVQKIISRHLSLFKYMGRGGGPGGTR